MFNKTTTTRQHPSGSDFAMGNAANSVLGSDLTVVGNLTAKSDIHIDGSVEGDIACASLVQGESSTVRGNVQADTARLSGTVHGSINARELVILRTARIYGDVHYDALTIEQGAQVDGRFSPRGHATPETTVTEDSEAILILSN